MKSRLVLVGAVIAGVLVAVGIAVLLVWPITDALAWHDVAALPAFQQNAHLQAAREAARTQMLTLGAGLFVGGTLIVTAASFWLSRRSFFHEQFSTIASQIGDDQPAVRLAGLQAMARLADYWKANQQGCIDVLCAYLRMNRGPDPQDGGASRQSVIARLRRVLWPAQAADEAAAARDRAAQDKRAAQGPVYLEEREVLRASVIRLIAEHLRSKLKSRRWRRYFDFTGAVFDVNDFNRAVFDRVEYVRFDQAKFSRKFSFDDARFSLDHALFTGARFDGEEVGFRRAEFSGKEASFRGAKFMRGEVWFAHAKFCGEVVSFEGAKFEGGSVNFYDSLFAGSVSFDRAEFRGTVGFDRVEFRGKVSFAGAKFEGGGAWFEGARFIRGGTVSFKGAEFSGGEVDFSKASFEGGVVDLSEAVVGGCRLRLPEGDVPGLRRPPGWSAAGEPPPPAGCLSASSRPLRARAKSPTPAAGQVGERI